MCAAVCGSPRIMCAAVCSKQVATDPVDLFHKYDTDESGTIDAAELEEMMFELGVKLSEENVTKAKAELGITEFVGADLWSFEEWWNTNFAENKKIKEQMIAKLSADMKSNYLPHIKKLFGKADLDKVRVGEKLSCSGLRTTVPVRMDYARKQVQLICYIAVYISLRTDHSTGRSSSNSTRH